MEKASLKRVKEIFQKARDKPESDRSGFVAVACRDDEGLRAEVEALLAADKDAGEFLASPTMDGARDVQRFDTCEVFAQLQRALSGRFSLERELGRGGMGIVYLARDVALDRQVAIKLLPPELAPTAPEARERFLREARTAASLSHPNVVPIHLVEENDGLVYFVMAFVDGESLGDRVRRAGPMKPADAAKLVQEVSWGLAYAHAQGVIHRDIKPDNILIDSGSGRALITDFGIARVSTTGTMSQEGDILGTLQYMSPEQASADGTIDGRADLYSLGVTAFFALTGRLPFESENPAALVAMHITEPAPPLKSVSAIVPARLAEAVDRCLAKDPDARFASGEALAEAIADAQVTRRDIAPSVREFLSAAKNSAAQMAILAVLGGAAYTAILGTFTQQPMIGHPFDGLFVLGAAIAVIVLARLISAARGVVRAGLDEGDVAQAVASSATARDANVEYELGRVDRLGNLLSTPWGRGAMLVIIGAGAWSAMGWIVSDLPHLSPLEATFWLLWFAVGGAFLLRLTIAPKRVIAALTRGTPESAGLWRRLWAGPIGRWCFKLAGIGLEKARALPVPEAAPTEVLLGRAAGELFEQLPKEQRVRLGDMQKVVRSLERTAATLRTRRDELANAIADVGEPQGTARRGTLVAELETAKATADERLATAVSALENLRLDLLRLKAGVGQPDDLTAAIEEARAVGEEVGVELAAREEVESLTKRGA